MAATAGALFTSTEAASATDGDALTVERQASRLDGALVALRRDLHAHPELSGQEQRTAAVVAARLRAAGLDVTTGVGGHGVVGVLTGTRPGRTVAYRADMDAVGPADGAGGATGPSHLCGHDLHTTIGVGIAEVLTRLRERLSGRLVFLFQPAEESLAGAAAMIADGVLTATRPSEIHALHCGPFPVGRFATIAGIGMPGQDRGQITLTGADAPARAQRLAESITRMSSVKRPADPVDLQQLLADLQTPGGPLARFVFVQAQAAGTTVRVSSRCWPEERYREVRAEIRRRARALGPATVDFPSAPFPAMHTPRREGQALERYLRRTLGTERVVPLHAAIPFNGEDFAHFLNRMPGTYTFLGVRAPGSGIETGYPHLATFNPDEAAIGHGVRTMSTWLLTRTRL
ncbi:N-acyl-L-amino acid amidohydrolase [Actinoplanes philippinensis]|uniref:Amidohydrolase n=1 Tax=Actinoplanes philippinensis TaxID=35752 RepID=A0A1I2B892_9ACTN|nr:M20/M25/M40 family metallo-hydrolase [Actinoplanes philippinensis]GIE75744.1 N-acyl-L-amino acid amidohydrolase [Actinoplanes philippinensis]SFE52207.1 amidohydrolase [Actinoplanes philippinensis]